MARHNKKRNVGLVYELLVRRLAQAVVEQDRQKIRVVKKIIESRFRQGTELYKEFRLFNALTSTNDVPDQIAYRILDEAKTASKDHNSKSLDIEKSRLIKDINHSLNEVMFFNTKIDNYAVYASAQQLFNSWRSSRQNISEIAKHETTIHSWLIQGKNEQSIDDHKTKDVNDVTVRVMQEKFEKKYGSSLSNEQTILLKLFCEGNHLKILGYMNEITQALQSQMLKTKNAMSSDRFLLEKVMKINTTTAAKAESCDVNEVSKAMALAQLLTELREFENVKS